ncbi:sugar transporter [Actinoplanes sp. NPDC051411]|uniref:lipopolysaccharide biosynthesis protein n=1 Tax=Actinoplanes sp. NPDC051411 TaxID=3155522 RepID=UPI00344896D0
MLRAAARRVAGDSLARNSVLIMASTVGTSGLGYLFWMVAARGLAPSAVGAATALISAATVVSMLSNLGIGHMFIQRLPGTPAAVWSRIVSGGLLIGCAATALTATAAAILLPRLAGNFAVLSAPALIATAVALTASTLLDYVFVAHRASHGMLWRNLALAAGKVLALPALTGLGLHDSNAVLLAWTLPSIAVTAVTLAVSPSRLRAGARLTGARLGREVKHVRAALSGHHLINLAQAGPGALLPVLVTARLGASANAHFYVAWMTASVLFMVSPAVASAFYAERSHVGARPAPLRKAATVVLAVIGAPAIVLFVAGDEILGLFSSGYATGGGLLLKILVIAAIPDAITNLAVAHWRSRREFRRCLHLNLVMASTCLALTWFWLPGLGIAAAGLAWLAGEFAGALLVTVSALTGRNGRRSRFVLRHRAAPRDHAVSRPAARATGRPPKSRPASRRKEASVR